jgi:hypothetical protein
MLFPSGLPTKTPYAPLLTSICATRSVPLITLDLISRIIFDEQYKPLSYSLCSLLQYPIPSSFLGPNIYTHTYTNVTSYVSDHVSCYRDHNPRHHEQRCFSCMHCAIKLNNGRLINRHVSKFAFSGPSNTSFNSVAISLTSATYDTNFRTREWCLGFSTCYCVYSSELGIVWELGRCDVHFITQPLRLNVMFIKKIIFIKTRYSILKLKYREGVKCHF